MKISDGKYRYHLLPPYPAGLRLFMKWLKGWRRKRDRPTSASDIAPHLKRDIGMHDDAGKEPR